MSKSGNKSCAVCSLDVMLYEGICCEVCKMVYFITYVKTNYIKTKLDAQNTPRATQSCSQRFMLSIRSKQMYRCIVFFAITSTCYAVVYQSDNCARFREKIDTPNFVKHQNTTYLPYSLPADYFGGPCPAPSYRLRNRLGTQQVADEDRFGLIPFLEALNRVFARVKLENPLLFSCIDGDIYHCRIPKGTSYYASHAFGAAIDIRIQSGDKWELDLLGDGRVMKGLLDLYPYMADEKLYWGAGFACGEDAVHFEVSRELFITWQQSNVI